MSSSQEDKKDKIYCDYKQFKGITFENNINSINNLLLGKSQKISNTQFIYVDKNDGKNYISANYFMIWKNEKININNENNNHHGQINDKDEKNKNDNNHKVENKENVIKMCYPQNFIYPIFFFDNKFYYINKNNELLIFKLEGNKVTKYVFVQKIEHEEKKSIKKIDISQNKNIINGGNDTIEEERNTSDETNDINMANKTNNINDAKKEKYESTLDTGKLNNSNNNMKDRVKVSSNNKNNKKKDINKEILYELKEKSSINIEKEEEFENKIEKLNNNFNLNKRYELLCNILKNDLKEKLNSDNPKDINKIIKINFEDIEKCELKLRKYELDCSGIIKEELHVQKDKISMKDGINTLINFIKNKKDKNFIDKSKINNTFKTPIIYKNFNEELIPQGRTIICEIKSGFYIENVKHQIEQRIDLVNDCLFDIDNEKPFFYIGIININENNIKILNNIKNILDNNFEFKENVMIIATMNYLYCEQDASYEIHTDYLLYKKLTEMDKNINNRFNLIYYVLVLISILLLLSFFFSLNIMNYKFDNLNEKFIELYQIMRDIKKSINNKNNETSLHK